ncbi:MAG: anti-phage deoxyguanosine triphosphatase, partial [Shewanella sp.]
HDLEDAIVMGIVTPAQWQQTVAPTLAMSEDPWIKQELGDIGNKLFSHEHHLRKDAIGTLVNGFVTAILINEDPDFEEPLLRFNATLEAEFAQVLSALKHLVYQYVIRKPEIQMLEYKGQQIVMGLFEAFASDPERLLPLNTQERWRESEQQGLNSHRILADYISGMTDEFAGRLYQQLFSPKAGSHIELSKEM